jgi:hypothetical protein
MCHAYDRLGLVPVPLTAPPAPGQAVSSVLVSSVLVSSVLVSSVLVRSVRAVATS